MQELTGDQSRQIIDTEQLFLSLREAERELSERYSGSMVWKSIKERHYLYRKTDGPWKCIGPQNQSTVQTHERFHQGRDEWRRRRASIESQIERMAPINRAMRLGRVPQISARVLRRIEKIGALGNGLQVVGTHALYAYERQAGVHLGTDVLTTRDVDLLYDARGQLDLVATNLATTGMTGLLRKIDPSFEPTGPQSFRAVNDKGFMVDLITPAVAKPALREFRQSLSEGGDDLQAAEITGLGWLESSPSISVVTLDERGFPLSIVAPDPRAFACHKLWLADRQDRDQLKARRDRAQALAIIEMLVKYLPHMVFDDRALEALPHELRERGNNLAKVTAERLSNQRTDWQ